MQISNRLGVTHGCDRQRDGRTDRRTDSLIAYASLLYAAWPKTTKAGK